MEGNKKENKENGEEKVKIYDKDMYISQEKLKMVALIIIIFIIGFIAGYFSGHITTTTSETNVKAPTNELKYNNSLE